MPPRWENPVEAKLSIMLEMMERQALREQRNTRFMLRVMTAQHEALLAALENPQRKGVVTFGAPQPKPAAAGTSKEPSK